MTIAAIAEREAVGETAALFAEIRRVLGVPVVNLVWRHLATFPGGLDWAWRAVRPCYVSGAAAREGAALHAALPLPAVPPWSRAELGAAGVDESGERTIVTVLDSYNRSNAMNLVALTALAARLQDGSAVGAAPAASVTPGGARAAVEGELPALLGVAEMAPATAEMVRRLDCLGERGEPRIPASMYRHLAHWPGFLGLAHARLAPLDHDGRLGGLIDGARILARAAAERVVCDLAEPGPAARPSLRAEVPLALAEFTEGVIAKMVPIAALLRRAISTAACGLSRARAERGR